MTKRKGRVMHPGVDLSDRRNGSVVNAPVTQPFPVAVSARLVEFNRQVQAATDARQAYLAGVLDVLGVDRIGCEVSVDLDANTYTVADRGDA